MSCQASQYPSPVRHIEQHEATHDRIEFPVCREYSQVAFLEGNILYAQGCDPAPCNLHRRRSLIDTQHGAFTPDHSRSEQRHIAETAADIEHLHAAPKARAPQHVLGELLTLRALVREGSRLRKNIPPMPSPR